MDNTYMNNQAQYNQGYQQPINNQMQYNQGYQQPMDNQMQYNQGYQQPMNNQMQYNQGYQQPMNNQMQFNQYYQQGSMAKDQFIKLPHLKKENTTALSASILCYAVAALELLLVFMGEYPGTVIIDVILVAALGLIIHLTKSFAASIVLLIYGIINVIYYIAVYGRLGGWLIFIVGIMAVIATGKINKSWKMYKENGIIV